MSTEQAWGPVRDRPIHVWVQDLATVGARLGLGAGTWQRLGGGEDCAAFGRGEVVLKLVPPPLAFCADRDTELLRRLHRRLPVAVPEVLALERVDGWAAVLLTRLSGRMAKTDWPNLEHSQRQRVVEQLGEVMAGLHQLPLADTDPDARSQRAGWRARYSGEEGEFLDRWLPEERGAVLLHLDLTDENVFIEAGRLTGILDFAGASTGDRAMELAAPGVFLVQGDHHLLRTMVRAAGLPDADPRERLAWHLLHPYSQLPRDLALCNAGEVHGLDEAAERIWG